MNKYAVIISRSGSYTTTVYADEDQARLAAQVASRNDQNKNTFFAVIKQEYVAVPKPIDIADDVAIGQAKDGTKVIPVGGK